MIFRLIRVTLILEISELLQIVKDKDQRSKTLTAFASLLIDDGNAFNCCGVVHDTFLRVLPSREFTAFELLSLDVLSFGLPPAPTIESIK